MIYNVATYDLESCNLCQIMCNKLFHLTIIPDVAILQNMFDKKVTQLESKIERAIDKKRGEKMEAALLNEKIE